MSDLENRIVVLGAGGHAKSVLDTILSTQQFNVVGLLDKSGADFDYGGVRVIGSDDDLANLYSAGVRYAHVGIGFLGKGHTREKLYQMLKELGFGLPSIIDPTAKLASEVTIGEGSFVGKGAVLNANATIGAMAIINTGAIVEHDAVVGNYAHLAPGAVVCGGACVGERAFLGAHATAIQEIRLGKGSVLAAGTVASRDLPDEMLGIGNPMQTKALQW